MAGNENTKTNNPGFIYAWNVVNKAINPDGGDKTDTEPGTVCYRSQHSGKLIKP